jgi:RNA polymerase sigma factor (sigma-70 family)
MPPPAEGLASRLFLGPALRAQPDRRLVTLVREGYEAAFEEIVRRYGRPLGRYAASIVGGRSEDVLQEAFVKALPALQRADAEIELRPWLFRIVRNTALNDLRDSPPSPELLAEALAGGRNPADELEQREQLADLMRRLRELPEPQRAAIVMRELEGLGHEEIAAALGLSGGGARQAIYRARQALRDGAGLLLPLPLLRLLIDHGGEAVGAGAGGALAAAGVSAGGAGASGALKLGVVAAVVAGSVGAGVAVQQHGDGRSSEARAAAAARGQTAGRAPASPTAQRIAPSASPTAASSGRRRGDSASGGSSGHTGLQSRPPGGARRVSRQIETHPLPPRRPPHLGGHEGERHGGRHGELSPHGGPRRPGPRHDGRSGPGRGDGELGDGRHGGRAPGDDGGAGGEGVRSPGGPGRRGDSGSGGVHDEGAAPPPPEETTPGGSGESEGRGESTRQGDSGETGREYE